MHADLKSLLVLPHLHVQNANAISGPLSWGFPAPSAFTGFVHALSRRMHANGLPDLELGGVGMVCHAFAPQVSGDYIHSFRLRRPNIRSEDDKRKLESGSLPTIVEEGRAHMQVSLVIDLHGDGLLDHDDDTLPALARQIAALARIQRLAGGSILEPTASDPEAYVVSLGGDLEHRQRQWRRLRRRLLPGFVLVARDDLLQERLDIMRETHTGASPLDALLDLTSLNFDCDTTPLEGGATTAQWHIRPRGGWLVPVPIGYSAISPLYPPGEVRNSRDPDMPFRFVESIYSLGQWISPHRIREPQQLLWHHDAKPDSGLYRCINTYQSDQYANA